MRFSRNQVAAHRGIAKPPYAAIAGHGRGARPRYSNPYLGLIVGQPTRHLVPLNRTPLLPPMDCGRRHSGFPEEPGPIEAACIDSFQSIVLLAAKEIDKRIDDMFKRGKQDESEPFFGPMCQLESDIRPMIEAEVRLQIHFTNKNRLASSVSANLLHTDGFLQHIRQYIKSIVEVIVEDERKKQEAHQAYLGRKEELLQLIQWEEYKQALETALSSNDPRLVSVVCKRLLELNIYNTSTRQIEPLYMLTIIAALSKNLVMDSNYQDRFLLRTVTALPIEEAVGQHLDQMMEVLKSCLTTVTAFIPNKTNSEYLHTLIGYLNLLLK
ncbi:enhancer of mRNA-decapping protein 4-like [Corythoichthys intestinalis]|uniref:enhancer of mRNA-decapping protein 4-like n=1 Tax=Corythoichthys intestinalis TaxID=161448 RepID=UPI0025A53088|nr:enhancer of mRNA-decapping protein 4-like [Corythoichthys intestinalis]